MIDSTLDRQNLLYQPGSCEIFGLFSLLVLVLVDHMFRSLSARARDRIAQRSSTIAGEDDAVEGCILLQNFLLSAVGFTGGDGGSWQDCMAILLGE